MIIIDNTWLTTNGPAPWFLNQANTTYQLAVDVTTNATAFIVGAANVIFDLNGHTITYGNSTPIAVSNGGFESGTGTSVPGWDLSGAPQAIIAAVRVGMWGTQMLHFTTFTTTQTIVTTVPIAIPLANRQYVATITPRSNDVSTVTLNVIDTVTSAVLASASSPNANRGFGCVAGFTPTTTNAVKLQVVIVPVAGGDVCDLDYAAVFTGGDYGIIACSNYTDLPTYLQTAPIIAACNNAASFRIQNGSITQGQARSYGGSPIFAVDLHGSFTADHVTIYQNGMDTNGIDASYARNPTITNCHFDSGVDNISDRMLEFAAIQLLKAPGTILVDSNTILNCVDQGINVQVSGPITINNNTITPNSRVTDGYGINSSSINNFVFSNNTINAINGRGILLDNFGSPNTTNGQIFGNTISSIEGPNLEYGFLSLETTALRVRGTFNGPTNVHIYNNTFTAVTDATHNWMAIGMRIDLENQGQLNNANDLIENNTFKAVVNTTDTTYTAAAVSISGVYAGTGLQINNNIMESNVNSLKIGDNDSFGEVNQDILMIGNTIKKSSDGAVRTFTAIRVGDYNTSASNIRIIDTAYTNGATPGAPNFSNTSIPPQDIETGWLLSVAAVGSGVAGAIVQVFNSAATQVFSGTMDANGILNNIPVVTTTYNQLANFSVTTTNNNPLTVRVSLSGGGSSTQVVSPSADTSLTFTFPTTTVQSDANISDNNTFTGAPIGVYSANGIPSGQGNKTILLWNTQFVGNQTGPAFAANGYQANLEGNSSFTGFTGGGVAITYYASNAGSDSNPGTSASPFLTLQKGVSVLKPGDTLIALAGSYAGFIIGFDTVPASASDLFGTISGNASTPITIEADPMAAPGSVIINAANAKTRAAMDIQKGVVSGGSVCNYIILKGFTISDGSITTSSNQGKGINVLGTNCQVLNCNITNITFGIGILWDNASFTQVVGNTVAHVGSQGNTSYGHGMFMSGTTDSCIVRANTIHDCDYIGLHIDGNVSEGGTGLVTNALIEKNFIHANGQNGINADGLQNSTIQNNEISYVNYGIVMYQTDAGGASTGNIVVNNTLVGL